MPFEESSLIADANAAIGWLRFVGVRDRGSLVFGGYGAATPIEGA